MYSALVNERKCTLRIATLLHSVSHGAKEICPQMFKNVSGLLRCEHQTDTLGLLLFGFWELQSFVTQH